ncbi:hypothetical protein [Chromobacterium haemolyticum]|uniref:hypothetical protein n=1 Tax=Chromobacterium haemolyticum TaxID=394935 RepID=UPI000D30476C|nr:hypothetical protein [Chromobacterium haemolyticum]PTU69649.1 hypothetical protein DBB33_09495 [Chromobacterium haemolyticum]
MTFSTFPPAMPPPACPHCAGQHPTPATVPVMEQLYSCSQRLPAVAGDMVLLGELGQAMRRLGGGPPIPLAVMLVMFISTVF